MEESPNALALIESHSSLQRLKEAIDLVPAEWEALCQAGSSLMVFGELLNWALGYLLLRCTKHFEPPGTDVLRGTERGSLPSVTKMADQIGVSRAHAYTCLRVVMRVPHEWAESHLPWSLKALASSYDDPERILEIAEENNLSYRQVCDLLRSEEGDERVLHGEERWREWFAKNVNSRNAWAIWRIFSERLEHLGLLAELREEMERRDAGGSAGQVTS